MSKKHLLITGAGGIIVISVAIALGLYYVNRTDTPDPYIYAFASDRTGSGDIFALNKSGEIVNLTNSPTADWSPVWSPDGTKLAFTSHRSGNSDIWLQKMNSPDGPAEPQNLTNDPTWDYSPTWSPSCQSVVFVSERDGDPEIFVQNIDSAAAVQLTTNDEMDRLPAWSPDGKLIAFAAVRDGMEQIRLIRPDGTDEQVATPPSLQGTAPAWAPDSQRLAFVGWDENNRPGIYVVGPTAEDLQQIYHSSAWLGSLNWSADGRWITFTSWESGNHEIYAIPAEGGAPVRLSLNPAWDDFLAVNPLVNFEPIVDSAVAQAAPASRLPDNPNLVAGVNLADLGLAYLINDLGFGWGKGYVNWATVETEPGKFRWVDPDNVVKALGDQEVKILLRVHGTPAWARPADSTLTHPASNLADFGNFITELATRYKGRVAAYEIWNEPNLYYEWGNREPDPELYTRLLQTAYTAIKAVDPDALVVSGGLSTTGDGSPTAYGDLAFIEGMYRAGAKGYFDALGSHPYPFGRSPEEVDPWGLSLSRVEQQHQVMVEHGDDDTPIWITEFGWVLDSNFNLGDHESVAVSELEQGQYLTDAYRHIQQKWPFVQAAFLFNLDFSTVSWYPAAEPMRWYAILNPDRTPRPAYTDLRQEMRNR